MLGWPPSAMSGPPWAIRASAGRRSLIEMSEEGFTVFKFFCKNRNMRKILGRPIILMARHVKLRSVVVKARWPQQK